MSDIPYLSFEEARAFAQALHFRTREEWRAYARSGHKPANIPLNANQVYKTEWVSWGDWLRASVTRLGHKWGFLPFEEARASVRALGIKNVQGWNDYCASGQKPKNIPVSPRAAYPSQFKGMGDWLGTGFIATKYRAFLPFEEARTYIHTLQLKDYDEWMDYCRSGQRPANIPSAPWEVYKAQWISYGDWLGTGFVASKNREYLPFEEARSYVRTLSLGSFQKWLAYNRSGKKPPNIPTTPAQVYKAEWLGWGDWLGTGAIATQWRKHSRQERREYRRIDGQRRRARKRTIQGAHTSAQIREMLARHRYRCYYCRKKLHKNSKMAYGYDFHIEHTFPLSRVAGTDIPANDISYLVPACPTCNNSKKDKYPWEFPKGGRLL